MRNSKETALKEVRVNRKKLIKKLRENKANHIKEYNEAVQGFLCNLMHGLSALSDELKNKIKVVKNAALPGVDDPLGGLRDAEIETYSIPIPGMCTVSKPLCRAEEYDRAIIMLEWSEDDEVVLSANDVNCYIMDNWVWKQAFVESHASNKVSAHKKPAP